MIAVRRFPGIMIVSVPVPLITKEVIEATPRRIGRPLRGRCSAKIVAAQSPFSDGRRRIARRLEHGAKGVIIFKGLVELLIAHVGVSLMHAEQKRSAGWRANGGRTIMLIKLHSFGGKLVEIRSGFP